MINVHRESSPKTHMADIISVSSVVCYASLLMSVESTGRRVSVYFLVCMYVGERLVSYKNALFKKDAMLMHQLLKTATHTIVFVVFVVVTKPREISSLLCDETSRLKHTSTLFLFEE